MWKNGPRSANRRISNPILKERALGCSRLRGFSISLTQTRLLHNLSGGGCWCLDHSITPLHQVLATVGSNWWTIRGYELLTWQWREKENMIWFGLWSHVPWENMSWSSAWSSSLSGSALTLWCCKAPIPSVKVSELKTWLSARAMAKTKPLQSPWSTPATSQVACIKSSNNLDL